MSAFWSIWFAKKKVLDTRMSGANKLSIVEWGNERALFFNNIPYSKLTIGSFFTESYYDFFIPLPSVFKRKPVKMLLIGLGGGTMPYQMHGFYNGTVKITAVEPDQTMIEMAKKFVPGGLSETKIVKGDGFEYLKKNRIKYDIIVLDAYVKDHMPRPFYTDEFMTLAKKSLGPDGILAINFAFDAIRLPTYILHLKRHFKVYRMQHIRFANYIIICSKKYDKEEILMRADLGLVEKGPLRNIPQLYKGM